MTEPEPTPEMVEAAAGALYDLERPRPDLERPLGEHRYRNTALVALRAALAIDPLRQGNPE